MSDPTVLEIVPGQTETFRVRYAGELPEGVNIASAAVSATNHFSGAADDSIFGGTPATVDGTDVVFTCSGLELDDRYDVTLTLTFDDATPSVFPDRSFLLICVERLS